MNAPVKAPVLIVIGASAGGVEALIDLTSQLPAELPAAILIVVHLSSSVPSYLPQVLGRRCKLPVTHAQDGEKIEAGHVYVALPDHHLMMRANKLLLGHGPRQNGHRPAIDLLFESAAHEDGPRVIGVILSGSLDDGARGLSVVKKRGGMAIVQSPEDAVFDSMPNSAMARTQVDERLPAAVIGTQIPGWVAAIHARLKDDPPMQETSEKQFVQQDKQLFEAGRQQDSRTMLTCPDCGGVLWEISDGGNLHYRCHVGHAYSIDSLQGDKQDMLERALWEAVRTLEENASLARRMAARAHESNHTISVQRFEARAEQLAANADVIRAVLEQHQIEPALLDASE